jgi:hypothetical protein
VGGGIRRKLDLGKNFKFLEIRSPNPARRPLWESGKSLSLIAWLGFSFAPPLFGWNEGREEAGGNFPEFLGGFRITGVEN